MPRLPSDRGRGKEHGRPAAQRHHRPANKKAGEEGLVWTDENLFKYLENPREFMPKNKMAFAGLKDEQERKDVIAYLKKFSQ